MDEVSPQEFRKVLGQYATGIAVVTARGTNGSPVGMTVNSFSSVSMDPPLVLWCVDKSAPPFKDFAQADYYAVHLLTTDQEALSQRFADDSMDKFADQIIESGIEGLPLLEQAHSILQCEVVDRFDAGDHLILLGKVLATRFVQAEPLIFFAGGYRRLK